MTATACQTDCQMPAGHHGPCRDPEQMKAWQAQNRQKAEAQRKQPRPHLTGQAWADWQDEDPMAEHDDTDNEEDS